MAAVVVFDQNSEQPHQFRFLAAARPALTHQIAQARTDLLVLVLIHDDLSPVATHRAHSGVRCVLAARSYFSMSAAESASRQRPLVPLLKNVLLPPLKMWSSMGELAAAARM